MGDNDVASRETVSHGNLSESGRVKKKKEEGQGGFKQASNQSGLPDSHTEVLKGKVLITWSKKGTRKISETDRLFLLRSCICMLQHFKSVSCLCF